MRDRTFPWRSRDTLALSCALIVRGPDLRERRLLEFSHAAVAASVAGKMSRQVVDFLPHLLKIFSKPL